MWQNTAERENKVVGETDVRYVFVRTRGGSSGNGVGVFVCHVLDLLHHLLHLHLGRPSTEDDISCCFLVGHLTSMLDPHGYS